MSSGAGSFRGGETDPYAEAIKIKERLEKELRAWGDQNVIGAQASSEEQVVAYVEARGYRVTGVETQGDHISVYYIEKEAQ